MRVIPKPHAVVPEDSYLPAREDLDDPGLAEDLFLPAPQRSN